MIDYAVRQFASSTKPKSAMTAYDWGALTKGDERASVRVAVTLYLIYG